MSEFVELYRPTEEHEAFRAAVRELCEEKVAPNAAEADELAEFPKASYEALVSADFHAPHIPEAYSGVGADALATVIVIEEIARVCAATSLVPGVNKLASLPWLLVGSEEIKQAYLPPIARGEAMASYCLSEPEAGSDAVSMVPTWGCSTARTPLSAASVATRSRLESSRFHPDSSSCGRLS